MPNRNKGKEPKAEVKVAPKPSDVVKEGTVVRLAPGVRAGSKEEKIASKAAARVKKERKLTISGVCRDLIKAGKTNEEVWEIIQPQFKMPEKHKHYPGWYRAQMVRQGELSKRAAKKTAHSPEPAPAKA